MVDLSFKIFVSFWMLKCLNISQEFVSLNVPLLSFFFQRVLEPHSISLEDDLNEAAKQVEVCSTDFIVISFASQDCLSPCNLGFITINKCLQEEMKSKTEGLLDPELLQQYAIVDKEADFEKALQNGGKMSSSGVISVKSSRSKMEKHWGKQKGADTSLKKRSKDENGSRSNKKRRH